MGFLNRFQRRLLWVAFVLLAGHVPLAAWLLRDATWLFNLVVAGLVATVLLIDESYEVKRVPPPDL
jgi:hypothetical protein